jgi:hypothetical protein
MTTWGWGNAVAASGFGNATLTRPAPATVPGAVDFVMVGGNNNGDGTGGSLWLSTAGEVYFAGTNSSGGYGDGTALSSGISHTSPVQVPGLSDIVKISMGGRAYYALASDGTLYGWGTNASSGSSRTPSGHSFPDAGGGGDGRGGLRFAFLR